MSSSTNNSNPMLTRETGCPVVTHRHSMTAGVNGPISVFDVELLEKLQLFNRENTPPRKVHALGTGCKGKFTVTNGEISNYSCAKLFSSVGKETEIFVRFSGIFTEQGEAGTMRDPRGFAIKFYTEEGNWDLLGINTPVFNVRDAKLGPDAIHACKRDIRTAMWNPTQTWDFCANHPESLHQFLMIYTDRSGTPRSFREMDGHGCHTFSMWNNDKQRVWVKFHIKACLGAQGFTMDEAKAVAAEDPNFLSRDLIVAINSGHFPKYKMYCQIMREEEAFSSPDKQFIAFDPTKVWRHGDYPLIEIGEIELNQNVSDHFCETEQVTFSPATFVPGIGLSPDRLLQGRLLIYDDTQYHRLGANFKKLPVNQPKGIDYPVNSMRTMGAMNTDTRNHYPNYLDSDYGGPKPVASETYLPPPMKVDGHVSLYPLPHEGSDADYYQQPSYFWNILSGEQKQHLCRNLAISFEKIAAKSILDKMLFHLEKIDRNLSEGVKDMMQSRLKGHGVTENERIVVNIAQELLQTK